MMYCDAAGLWDLVTERSQGWEGSQSQTQSALFKRVKSSYQKCGAEHAPDFTLWGGFNWNEGFKFGTISGPYRETFCSP